jgi:hypothetical protein
MPPFSAFTVPPLLLTVKSKVTALPLTAVPALLVTLTVRILVCPDERDVGDPVNAVICCPEPVVGVISSSLLPHPLRQKIEQKELKGLKETRMFSWSILPFFSPFYEGQIIFLGFAIFTRNIISFQSFYCETQISKTNNLKVTIGVLKFVSRSESQISEAKRTDI